MRARSQRQKDVRRHDLAAAALDEFYEKGFAAARMDDIARRAAVSKGALYLYFDSKEALFADVVERFAVPNVDLIEATAMAANDMGAVIDAVTGMAPTLLREGRVPKLIKVIVADAPAFPAMCTAYRRQVVDRVLGVISRVLSNARDRGEIDVAEPALAARIFVAPMILSAIWRIVFEHDAEAQVDYEALFSEHRLFLRRAFGLETC